RVFGFEAPIAVEAVVPGSPAEAAGVAANDSIVRVDGVVLEPGPVDTGQAESTDRTVAADRRLTDAARAGAVTLDLLRAGQPVSRTITPRQGCASRFEVTVRNDYDSRADGAIVQVSTKMIEAVTSDDELAFVVAHELAHNILRHRARLDAAGVSRGMFESVGRSVGYIRRTEIEADLLGIALMANAGYDVAAPARFWRWFGKAHFNSILLARTHPRWTTRAALLEREAALIAASPARPYVPPILAERDKPLSNDWQALVAGL
ncbi:M48 family metallopeptidase, partial [Sphingomonas sp.]|uniref:M48 family metallopeptidase n=1 Tax=Sphingomonas sp. TaxID=28214 RepID=UPI002C7E172B